MRSAGTTRGAGEPARLRSGMLWLLIFAAAALSHASYVNNGFVWLDHLDIEAGQALIPAGKWWAAFAARFGATGFYRPVVTLAHSFDHAVYGLWAPGYHLTNVVLHAAVAVAAAKVFGDWLDLLWGERLGLGLAVGVHPLSWLPVGAISYRPELLAALLVFSAFALHLRARAHQRWGECALAGVAVFLASGTKEAAPVWLAGLFVVDLLLSPARLRKKGGPRTPARTAASAGVGDTLKAGRRLLVAEFAGFMAYFALRMQAVPDLWHASASRLGFGEAIGTRLSAIGRQFLWLVSPLKPALSDATRITGLISVPALVALAVLAGLLLLGLKSRPASLARIALFYLALALAPALNLVPLPRFASPHYGYFAVAGAALFGLAFLRELWEKSVAGGRAAVGIFIAWLALAGVATFAAGPQFRSDATLFAPEVAGDENFREGHFYLGEFYRRQRDLPRAARAYEAALVKEPGIIAYVDRTAAAINLAGIYVQQGKFEQAEDWLAQAASQAAPARQPEIAYNRAVLASRRGDADRVVALLDAPGRQWTRPEPLLLLAQALEKTGRTTEALQKLEQALPLLSGEQRRRVQAFIARQKAPPK